MTSRSVAELIDDLLAAEKTIEGVPDWRDGRAIGEERLSMPLSINGLSTGSELVVTGYPNYGSLKFRIMIIVEKSVCRIDFVHDELHINSFNRPNDLSEYQFMEPHYHSWRDNRRFCTHKSLPERLENARILPKEVRSFDNVLRWFCADTHISQPPSGLITLPPRRRLI